MAKFDLFDKRINLYFYRTGTPAVTNLGVAGAPRAADRTVASIVTPETGRKQTIRLKGGMVGQDMLQQLEIEVTNFTTDVPLSDYRTVLVEAGYKGAMWAAFSGEIVNSFRESPGPDGVTTFQMTVGNFTDWMTKTLTAVYSAGVPLRTVLNDVAQKLGLTLKYLAAESLTMPVGISHNGLAKDLIVKLRSVFSNRYTTHGDFDGLVVRPDGPNLIAYQGDKGTGTIYELQYISAADRNAAGFDIQAPWIPAIRPGDTVKIDPKYFRQELGAPGTLGSPAGGGNLFQVIYIDFEFDTEDVNQMTLTTVAGV